MTNDNIETFQLPNGLEVVVQPMADVQSAALTLMVPAGSVYDPPGKSGVAAILAEMFPRGGGDLSARQLSSAMDNLGLQRSVSSGTAHVTVSTATTADRILQAIPLIASMVRQPHLTELQFPPARELVVQGLQAEEDEPKQRLGRYLRQCAYATPWSNSSDGSLDDIGNIALVDVQRHFDQLVRPNSAILGIAGNVNPAEVLTAVHQAFDDWERGPAVEIERGAVHASPHHIPHDSAQTHIGLAWSTVPYAHERYFAGWAAVSVLSGGMSSRLFTEVREKRGLCYAVSASINTLKDEARIFGYAGTTNERAQETLDVMVAEIRRLHEGLTDEELRRCKARAKSTLIMQQESTMARSGALARDTFHLGRVMLLDEIHQRIDEITVDQVREFAIDYAPTSMALVTIGPQTLDAACVQPPAAAV